MFRSCGAHGGGGALVQWGSGPMGGRPGPEGLAIVRTRDKENKYKKPYLEAEYGLACSRGRCSENRSRDVKIKAHGSEVSVLEDFVCQ